MKFEILVQLKKEVLDPEGRAIQEALDRLGFSALRDVQVSKRYVLDLDLADAEAERRAEQIAREYLANPVSQTFQLRRL